MNTATRALAAACGLAAMAAVGAATGRADQQTRPTFRSRGTLVSVDASIKSGNNPVIGLTPADFLLTDNGVPQEVETVDVAAVPIDVTVVVDVSGSTRAQLSDYQSQVLTIAKTLRPADRLRLIVFSTEVQQLRRLLAVDPDMTIDDFYTSGYSSVFDGIGAALLRRIDVDRRHLIVAFTDGMDNTSILTLPMIRDIAKQSEAVLHLSGCIHAALTAAAESTGGANHAQLWQGTMATSFKSIFDDFRQSYILRYQPAGVAPTGWHDIKVTLVRKGRFTIHARRGYFGGAPRP